MRGVHHGSDRSVSEVAEEKKHMIIKAEKRYMSHISLVKMEFKYTIDVSFILTSGMRE